MVYELKMDVAIASTIAPLMTRTWVTMPIPTAKLISRGISVNILEYLYLNTALQRKQVVAGWNVDTIAEPNDDLESTDPCGNAS